MSCGSSCGVGGVGGGPGWLSAAAWLAQPQNVVVPSGAPSLAQS